MNDSTMTPRERWDAILSGSTPDRTPMDIWATPEVFARLRRALGAADDALVCRQLHIDRPYHAVPPYRGPRLPEGQDIYGCRRELVDYGTGAYLECTHHPLADCGDPGEVDRVMTWPDPDWFDYSALAARREEMASLPVQAGGSEPFMIYKDLRGEEQAYMDLVENPELVHHCLEKLFSFCHEHTRRILEQLPGLVTYCYVAEDLGSQESLLYSPRHIRRFFLPGMKRMVELAHQAGAYAFCHTDGAVRRMIPDLIEIGMDILNPIQWRCPGMEREALARDFGHQLIFHGGVDNQQTLAFGTPEQVAHEVAQNLEILGRRKGYILAPCHNIQPLTPIENILTLYRTGLDLG